MNGRELEIFVPFDKARIDKANRMVYGTAQIEERTPDLQGDIVDWNATKNAFDEWFNGIRKGNVREMHRKDMAVGQAVVMRPLEPRREMLVGVHVSKGAESTWQKVLDGTLRGFSIGGYATRSKQYFDSKIGRRVNKVFDYVLTELSLVDVPANPKCRILGIQKNLVAPGLTGDVSRKGREMFEENPALAAIADMAKSVDPEEEVLIIKRADIVIEGEGGDKRLLLKNDAAVSEFVKGADLQTLDEAIEQEIAKSAGGSISAEDLATFGKAFATICKAAGYDPTELVKDAPLGEITKGMREEDVVRIVKEAVGDRDEALFSVVGELKKSVEGLVSGQVQPRKGVGGDGTAEAQTRALVKLDGGEEGDQHRSNIQKSLDAAYQKRNEIIAKMDAGQPLSPTEKVEQKSVGETIDKLEAALATPSTRIVASAT